jgi:uncharacterized protein YycO
MSTIYSALVMAVLSIVIVGCSSSKKVTKEQYDDIPKNAIEKEARTWLGTKYKYGGNTRNGIDCSGLVVEVFRSVMGIKLPRTSAEQQKYCKNINKSELHPGDLLFFATGKKKKSVTHVGIYIGDGRMIHASSSRGVIVSGINEAYYRRRYLSSGRIEKVYKKLRNQEDKVKKKTTKKISKKQSIYFRKTF